MDKKEPIDLICPNCKSDNIGRSRKPASIVGYLLLVIGLPIPAFDKKYHCFDCFTDFKLKEIAN